MKRFILIFSTFLFFSFGFSQTQTISLKQSKNLVPQEIEYDGKPALEYTMNEKIIALTTYSTTDEDGSYIRMKINNKEQIFKMQKKNTSKVRRVYSNTAYVLTFFNIVYGACSGEGGQYLSGKLLIQSKSEQNTVNFKGYDAHYSSKKCWGIGNG